MKKIVLFLIIALFLFIFLKSCGPEREPAKLERALSKNKDVFTEVVNILNDTFITDNVNIISIDKPNTGDNRIFYTKINPQTNEDEKVQLKELNEYFSNEQCQKIEKIFSYDIIYIEAYPNRIAFAQKGFLDCNDEIVYSPEPEKIRDSLDSDDVIIKDYKNGWFIYGVR